LKQWKYNFGQQSIVVDYSGHFNKESQGKDAVARQNSQAANSDAFARRIEKGHVLRERY